MIYRKAILYAMSILGLVDFLYKYKLTNSYLGAIILVAVLVSIFVDLMEV